MSNEVEAAVDALYGSPPEEFLARRKKLADEAKAAGRTDAAKEIAALRKPTASAAAVNTYLRAQPKVVDEITDLGRRLREAQDALDAPALRELSNERRSAVQDITAAIVRGSEQRISAAVTDEVRATVEAAIADPDVAQRLGRLERAEHWSGFGFDAGLAPTLTLVQGTKDATPRQPAAKPKPTAAARRNLQRTVDAAQNDYDSAEATNAGAEEALEAGEERVRQLTDRLARLQEELAAAKHDVDGWRDDVKHSRQAKRQARSALDRALREAQQFD